MEHSFTVSLYFAVAFIDLEESDLPSDEAGLADFDDDEIDEIATFHREVRLPFIPSHGHQLAFGAELVFPCDKVTYDVVSEYAQVSSRRRLFSNDQRDSMQLRMRRAGFKKI